MNRIRQIAEQRGWDFTLFRQKVNAYCVQNGQDVPSDNSIRHWWDGGRMWDMHSLLIAKVLEVTVEGLYMGGVNTAKKG